MRYAVVCQQSCSSEPSCQVGCTCKWDCGVANSLAKILWGRVYAPWRTCVMYLRNQEHSSKTISIRQTSMPWSCYSLWFLLTSALVSAAYVFGCEYSTFQTLLDSWGCGWSDITKWWLKSQHFTWYSMRLVGEDAAFRLKNAKCGCIRVWSRWLFYNLSTVEVQLLSSQRAKIGAVRDSNRTACHMMRRCSWSDLPELKLWMWQTHRATVWASILISSVTCCSTAGGLKQSCLLI